MAESSSASLMLQQEVTEQKRNENRMRKVLDELRQDGFFCDATIRCGNKTFKVHRNVMSTCSPYFQALFTYEENPGEQPKKKKRAMSEINIQDMSPEIMEIVIRYAYTRDLPSDLSTVVQIIQAADRFQIEGLLKTCFHALEQQISLETCMQIRSLARAFPFSCCAIKVAADKFLLENFTWIYCFSADFLQLDTDDLCDVLANDRLNVRSESIPLDAVCR